MGVENLAVLLGVSIRASGVHVGSRWYPVGFTVHGLGRLAAILSLLVVYYKDCRVL